MPGVATIDAVGPGGPVREQVYLGSVVTLPLGDGQAGRAGPGLADRRGRPGLRSRASSASARFVVLRADDLQAQVVAHKSAAEALRQELDFVMGTRSWKVTAPLRKWKGRGA